MHSRHPIATLSACQQHHPRSVSEVQQDYDARIQRAISDERNALVWIECDHAPSGRPCGLLIDDLERGFPVLGALSSFVFDTCHENPHDGLSENCMAAFGSEFLGQLHRRYLRAVSSEVTASCEAQDVCSLRTSASFHCVELLFMKSHNDHVDADASATLASLQAERDAHMRRAGRAAEAEQDRRRVLAIIAAGLQGFSGGTNKSPTAVPAQAGPPETASVAPPTPIAPTVDTACTSDFQCGFGSYCVKAQFAGTGTCAKAVDQFGTRTFAPPRLNSVGPGQAECTLSVSDCPIGFQCIKGHCMK